MVIGERHNHLTLVALASAPDHVKQKRAWATWRCDCGNTKNIRCAAVMNGHSKTCGCGMVAPRKHGQSRTPAYKSWHGMLSRCYRPGSNGYVRYGGRGIRVCERWRNSFELFLQDMGERPKGKTLDRINVDGDYEPSNCRWATVMEQAKTHSRNRLITFNGVTLSCRDWDRERGFGTGTMAVRLRLGWSVERSISFPQRKRRKKEKIRTGEASK